MYGGKVGVYCIYIFVFYYIFYIFNEFWIFNIILLSIVIRFSRLVVKLYNLFLFKEE